MGVDEQVDVAGVADETTVREGTTTNSTGPKPTTIHKARTKCTKQDTIRADKISINTHSNKMRHTPTQSNTTKTGIIATHVGMTWKITTRARHAPPQNQTMSGQLHVKILVEDAVKACIKLICDGEGRKIMHLVIN